MKNTTEQTISISVPKGASDIRVMIIKGKVEISFNNTIITDEQDELTKRESNLTQEEYIEKYFPIVKASKLSLDDEFLKHVPESKAQRILKEWLTLAIKSGLSDFRAQRMDPSLDENGWICYKPGMKPAIVKDAKWWKKKAEEFMPEKESRLGKNKERSAFLGVFIKYLIEEQGYTVSNAWKAVCDESKYLGHYYDSENAEGNFETTGSRRVGDWCDLANTFKLIFDDELGGFSLVGGSCGCDSFKFPLAAVNTRDYYRLWYYNTVGWIVLSV